ncbi:MAG: substrate binding domain-containing protein, partial [Pseudomonadota bacterium]
GNRVNLWTPWLRGRAPADSNLISRKLEDAQLVVVAAPVYLAHAGIPVVLEDLKNHDCIQFVLPSSGRNIAWLFKQNGKEVDVLTRGGYSCSEDLLGGVTLARHGGGLFQTYRYFVEEDLKEGSLIELLADFGGRTRPFTLLYPHGRHLTSRVRTFVDFLLENRQ